jgi:hypothetical protein
MERRLKCISYPSHGLGTWTVCLDVEVLKDCMEELMFSFCASESGRVGSGLNTLQKPESERFMVCLVGRWI